MDNHLNIFTPTIKMKKEQLIILISIFIAAVVTLSGCAKVNEDDSSIPWSRPADWENRAPGMPGM